MAYIAPDSIIRICKNIPLNNTYQDTFYFTNKTDQFSYFLSKAKYTVSEYSYQRKQKKLMVGITADNLFDCNYLVYKNTAFGDKYFYAFITDVEYISDEVSAISFEIDVLQTWHFDYNPSQCFVAREHSRTDERGDNLVPENISTGEYIKGTAIKSVIGVAAQYYVIFAVSVDEDGHAYRPTLQGNLISCVDFKKFSLSETTAMQEFIEGYTQKGKTDAILSVFMIPAAYYDALFGSSSTGYIDFRINKYSGAIDGYTPKNNKLYTYPYCFLYADNMNGTGTEFKEEYFTPKNSETMLFRSTMSMYNCNPSLFVWPANYKGDIDAFADGITLMNFPQVAYNIDVYKVQLCQNVTSTPLFNVSNVINGINGGIYGGAAAVVGNIADTAKQYLKWLKIPPSTSGVNGQTPLFEIGRFDIRFYHVTVTAETAKIIDDYFTRYGYAINRLKTPDRTSRPEWNYVKTVGANLLGSIPTPDMQKLVSIYDNGITFWHNPEHIGLYDLDNSPTGG